MTNQITASKVIVKDLHETGSLLPTILNKLPQFAGVSRRPFSEFIMVNETGWKLFEMDSEAEMLTRDITQFFADDVSDENIAKWKEQLDEDGFFSDALCLKTKAGNKFWALLRMDSFSHADQDYQLVSIRDISESRRAEVAAGRDQEKFRTLFENSTIGIIATNTAGEISLINHFAEEQFGYDKDELIGSKIEKLIPHEVRGRHVGHREKFVKEMHTRPMGIGMDLYGLRKDETKFPVEISLSHFTTQDGTFAIAFINDITIRKKNEDAFLRQQEILQKYAAEVRELNQQLEQRVEERTLALRETLQQLEKSKEELERALSKEKELGDLKSRFVSMASHEFRTPLSSILSSAALIEKYPAEDQQEKRQKHINRIKENVKT